MPLSCDNLGRLKSFLIGTYLATLRLRKLRPHVCATFAAGSAGEAWLDVRQPDIIAPALCADLGRMAAAVIAAIDQHIADAEGARLAEGDFCWRFMAKKITLWASPSGPHSTNRHQELERQALDAVSVRNVMVRLGFQTTGGAS
jgi:hypothetical protein